LVRHARRKESYVGNDSLDVLLCRRWRICGPSASLCGERCQTASWCI